VGRLMNDLVKAKLSGKSVRDKIQRLSYVHVSQDQRGQPWCAATGADAHWSLTFRFPVFNQAWNGHRQMNTRSACQIW
jgi:hypothetical protein